MSDSSKAAFGLKLRLELLSWLISFIILGLVIYPITNSFADYRFMYGNILFVLVFLTYTRYIFLLKHTFLAHYQPMKFFLVFASIPLIFHQIELIQNFQEFVDTEGLVGFEAYFLPGLSFERQEAVVNYMRREYIFFGVGSVIVAVIMPFRMLISYWRVYNQTGTV